MFRVEVSSLLRRLRSEKAFACATLATVALTTALAASAAAITDSLLFQPLPYADVDRLVAIGPPARDLHAITPVAGPTYAAWRDRSRTMASWFAAVPINHALVLQGAEPVEVAGMALTSGAFDALKVRGVQGRVFGAQDYAAAAEPVILLGKSLADALSPGDPRHLIGRTIKLASFDTQVAHRIVGILPSTFRLRPAGRDFYYIPVLDADISESHSNALEYFAMGRLHADSSAPNVASEVRLLNDRASGGAPPIRVIHLRSYFFGSYLLALTPMLVGAAVLLLLGCTNVSALALARSASRLGEVRTRMALGASRRHIAVHVAFEICGLWLVGAVVGVLGGYNTLRVLTAYAPSVGNGDAELLIRWPVVAVLLFTFACAAVMSSLIPAARLSRSAINVSSGLSGRGSVSSLRVQRMMGSLQIGLVVILLTSAASVAQSVRNMLDVPLGFSGDGVRAIRLRFDSRLYGPQGAQLQARLSTEMSAAPGVLASGWTSELPLGRETRTQGRLEDGREFTCAYRIVDGGYMGALTVGPITGRSFGPLDMTSPVVIVNSSFARAYLPAEQIGAKIFLDEWREVVGVVSDIHEPALTDTLGPTVYWPFSSGRWMAGAPWLVVHGRKDKVVDDQIRAVLKRVAPDVPVIEVTTVQQRIAEQMRPATFLSLLLVLFSVVGLGIAVCGLFGTAAYASSSKTREYGLRLALGATPRGLLRTIGRETLIVATVGGVIGTVGAWWSAQWLATWAFGIPAFDGATVAGTCAALMLLTIATALAAARQAVHADPSVALRAE